VLAQLAVQPCPVASYVNGVPVQLTLVLDPALLIVKLAELLLVVWLASPAKLALAV
jgi:hypothetical protein